MNRLKSLLLIMGLMVIMSLLIACSSLAEPPPPTATPTAVPEPPTPVPVLEESVVRASSEVPRITPEDLKARLDEGEEILIVDTRGKTAFEGRHIAGSIIAPDYLNEPDALGDYPQGGEIVLYCD